MKPSLLGPHLKRIAIAVLLVMALSAPVSAADPSPGKAGREFVEMFWMILTKGADMGPTDGWFHPARSPYGWDWLKARDRDRNESISPEELGASAELFRRLDRDHDGAIKPEDLDWSPRSAYLRQQQAARRRFVMIDTNSNGRISKEEWDAFFARASRDRRALTPEDLSDAFDPPAPEQPKGKPDRSRTSASAEPSRWTLLVGLFKGELGSRYEGSRVGDLAPDFTLKTHDGRDQITLSRFRDKQPVVLVFGNFT
jgi:hypothetical protein